MMMRNKSPRQRSIKILASRAGFSLDPCLEALEAALAGIPAELFLLDDSETEATAEICAALKKRGAISSHAFFSLRKFPSIHALANQLFLQGEAAPLLFLRSDILLAPASLTHLLAFLEKDARVAGANPRLAAGWLEAGEKRAAFMGLTLDYRKRLHYLYEGIPANGPLARGKRRFQLAHPGAFLLRGEDFQKAGGFRQDLGFLAQPALCMALTAIRKGGFICPPESEGVLLNPLDSWNHCGMWDSILQRGRLKLDGLRPDYVSFCHADGLGYTCDAWLAEGPENLPGADAGEPVKSWLEWRRHPRPATLLAFLLSLPPDLRETAVELCRNRPASLPGSLARYQVDAEQILSSAGNSEPALSEAIASWQKRIRRFQYGELKPGMELLKKAGIYNCSLDICPAIYDAWIETAESFTRLEPGEAWPEIAVVMPVWNPDRRFLAQAIESVLGQTYGKWRLCIADDASTDPEIRPLLESFQGRSSRIRLKFRSANGHICHASNSALEMVDAPFTAFLDHDDLLSPHALMEVAALAAQRPDLGYIYSDDDRIDEWNVRRSPFFKPDFPWGLFESPGHLSVYATGLLRKAGGLRPGTEGAQDTDLCLRLCEGLDFGRIAHIPKILYHWRVHENSTAGSLQAKPYVLSASRQALLDAAARRGLAALEVSIEKNRIFRLLCAPPRDLPCAVILLAGEGQPSQGLLRAIGELAGFVKVKFYAQPLREGVVLEAPCELLPFASENIAEACNAAAARVEGEVLLFLSASLEPGEICRLEQLVEFALRPAIAMAGANIWHGLRLANGGWQPNADGRPFRLLRGMIGEEAENSAWGQLGQARHVLGVSWECMAVRREFCKPGEFLESGFGPLSPVDFALRAMEGNRFAAITPWVQWQVGKPVREPAKTEMEALQDRWGSEIARNGLRNPNLRAAPDRDWTLIL